MANDNPRVSTRSIDNTELYTLTVKKSESNRSIQNIVFKVLDKEVPIWHDLLGEIYPSDTFKINTTNKEPGKLV